ncbi:protein adenylyltransferase SelO [Peredibacter starrii]|uniref:Protein nucleotidyltransferase YdiU n=1 Tax=Peredibacter starrii TaxID=28202 RepID=A0AAX4HTC9_9BACT|nr:YdiU family protein [Peredibacter starrii]WPU66462.1 YdiU family protein [Peredibacter starrii]
MPKFDNTFRNLPAFLYEDVRPTPISHPKLIHVSRLANDFNLGLTDEELVSWLNGEKNLPGEQRISTRYAGHQFGVWAGQLGDGRAISLGEILTDKIGRQEIQTKGSGLTPFSRRGDGKAVIRSSVREYLCSEAMFGLGIPTTRVLALVTGDDRVYRETVERSAIVARVFPSNLRFGHFEMCFHFEKDEELKALIEYTRSTFYPGLSVEEMLREIITRTAKLMAQWQNVGFCHGVMNTDNMSALGLTIDYGPYGFLEDTILNYICNHSDHQGRYAYNQQPSIGMWNLERLLVCFLKEVPKEKLQVLLNEYPMIFEAEYQRLSREKLGLYKEEEKDFELFIELLQTLNKLSVDYTFFFRTLAEGDLKKIWDYYGNREELKAWNERYEERLTREELSKDERILRMKKTNPKFVLKNYIAQEIIEDVEAGSSKKLEAWLNVFYAPFDEHPEFESYAGPTPPNKKNFEVSCSS